MEGYGTVRTCPVETSASPLRLWSRSSSIYHTLEPTAVLHLQQNSHDNSQIGGYFVEIFINLNLLQSLYVFIWSAYAHWRLDLGMDPHISFF